MDKLVSIVIPAYNAEQYIEECVNSILKQSYSNLEIIIVNDGSIDNTSNIVRKIAKQDNRIIVIDKLNEGAPKARNLGIEKSHGEYILFFDADDFMNDGCIKTMVTTIEKYNADVYVGSYCHCDEKGNLIRKFLYKATKEKISAKNINKVLLINPLPGNKLYKSKVIKENNIRFSNVMIGQDLNFFLKYLSEINFIFYDSTISFCYRILQNSISRTYTEKILDILKSLDNVKEFYYSKEKKFFIENIDIVYLNHINVQMKKTAFMEKTKRKYVLKELKESRKRVKMHIANKYYIKEFIRYDFFSFLIFLLDNNIFEKKIKDYFFRRMF